MCDVTRIGELPRPRPVGPALSDTKRETKTME